MIHGNQRWRDRKALFRRPDEQIRTGEYDVAIIPGDAEARGFVEAHHYSGSYPAARRRFGLYRRGDLVGVAVFSVPCHPAVLSQVLGCQADDAMELGRFVLLDDVPGNGETWFLGRAFRLLRQEGFAGVVSFSDPVARSTATGQLVFPGHLGTIYQAFNGVHCGRSKKRTLAIMPDGRVFSERAICKIRCRALNLAAGRRDEVDIRREKGWAAAVEQLVSHGAAPAPAEDGPALLTWLRAELGRLTRPLRHPGNLRYAWSLRRDTAILLPSMPYPKLCA